MALRQEPRNLCGQGNIVWEKHALGVCVCVCGHKAQGSVNQGNFGSLKPNFTPTCKTVRASVVDQW